MRQATPKEDESAPINSDRPYIGMNLKIFRRKLPKVTRTNEPSEQSIGRIGHLSICL